MNAFQLIVSTKYFRDCQVEDLFFFHSMSNQHWKTRVSHLLLLLALIRSVGQLLKVVEMALDAFSRMLKVMLSAWYDQIYIKDNDQVHHVCLFCSHILHSHCHLYHCHPFLRFIFVFLFVLHLLHVVSCIRICNFELLNNQVFFSRIDNVGEAELLLHDEYPKPPFHSTIKVIFLRDHFISKEDT